MPGSSHRPFEPAPSWRDKGSYSFPCTQGSAQCTAPGCSPGPTALAVLSARGHFLQVLSHLSASERVSLASYKTNGVVTNRLWRTGLFHQKKRRKRLSPGMEVILRQPRGSFIKIIRNQPSTWYKRREFITNSLQQPPVCKTYWCHSGSCQSKSCANLV